MSLKLKLTIASVGSLVLIAALCFLFLRACWLPDRRAAEPPAPTQRTAVAHLPLPVKKAQRAAPQRAREEAEPGPAVVARDEGGWRITGRIVRDDPKAGVVVPVEGVIVLLKSQPRRTKPVEVPLRRMVTGPDGGFDLEHVPGTQWMRIEMDEPSSAYRTLSFQLGEPQDNSTRDVGDIFLEPATTLTIQLVGPTGKSAARGRVLVGRNASMRSQLLAGLGINESRLEAEEKQPGTYVLERAAPGSHYIQATAPGCSEGREEVELPRPDPLVMRLTEGHRIAGTVTSDGEAAIAKAELEILSGPGVRELAPRTTTDAAGRFVFDTLARGEYVIGARADGFASARRRSVASGTEDLEIILEPEAVFAGKVVAGADGRAVVKAEVTLRDLEGQTLSESSDEKGIYRLRGIDAGIYTMTASHPDFAPAIEGPIEIRRAERIEGRVTRLPAGVAASGKVLESESGEPVADAHVSCTARGPQGAAKSARTNAEGAFEVKGLAEGRYEVRASGRGYFHGEQRTIEVPAGGVKDLAFTLVRGGSIAGSVLDPDGKPVAGALVQPSITFTKPEEWNEAFESISNVSARADSEGRYRLDGLPAHRFYLVKASSANLAPASLKGIAVGWRQDVEGADLTLTRGGAIRGRVADDKGTPMAGATVQAEEEMGEERPMVYTPADAIGRNTRTDPEGNYTLSPLKAGAYTVTSRAKDHTSSKREKIKVADGRTIEGIDLVLADGEVLAGRVVDADGNGIAAADVSVQDAALALARTDAEGRFQIGGLRPGDMTLNVWKEGFVEVNLQGAVPGREVTVKLERLAKIAGKVQAQGRDSFPSFQVIAVRQGDERPEPASYKDPTQSDPTGRFEVEVGPGTYVLQATVRGFAPSRSKPLTIKAAERHEGVVIDLLAGGTANGVVVERSTETPIEGAHVRLRGDDVQPWNGFSAATAKTGPDGSFTLEGVPQKFTLIATHVKYAPAIIDDLSVPPGESTSVRVEMGSGGGIRGTVSEGGAPVAGVEVHASKQGAIGYGGKQTTTDSSGRFELVGLPAGEYMLEITARKGASVQRTVVVGDGEVAEMAEVDIGEGAGLRLFGRVTSGGAPIAGGSITAAQPEKGWASGGQRSIDASGAYSLRLPAPGTYTIIVQTGRRSGLSGRVDVTVPEGVSEYHQDIKVPRGGLSGAVVDVETGEPIRGAHVMAYFGRPGPLSFLSLIANLRGQAEADDAGRFGMASLAPGRYSLRASADGYEDGGVEDVRVDTEGEASEIEIALERGITFSAWIVDEKGQPVAKAAALLRNQGGDAVRVGEPARSREDGRLELSGLRPGTYKMTVVHRAYAPARVTVEAAPGAEQTVTLRPGGKVNVTVTTRQGRPVEGAAIELLDEGGENMLEAMLFLSFMSGGAQLQTKADGAFILDQVPTGTHRIAASTEAARSREERIQVKKGETTEVRLTLE